VLQSAQKSNRVKALTFLIIGALGFGGCGSSSDTDQRGNVVVLARGSTLAGTTYSVSFERGGPDGSAIGGEATPTIACPLYVAIVESGSSPGIDWCLAKAVLHGETPVMTCSHGLLTVRVQAQARATQVRLSFNRGQPVVSRVVAIPKRLGGPAGVYFQVTRASKVVPIALTEIDKDGSPLRTVALPKLPWCGGQRGAVPQGPATVTGARPPQSTIEVGG
jgi:hypothetical protein